MVFSTSKDLRYSACRVLRQNGIPCVVWCEDALGYYGMNTTLFSLNLVVASVDEAADVLLQHGGWTALTSSQRPKEVGVPWLDMPEGAMRRLLPPDWVENPVRSWPPPPPSQMVPRQPELVLHAAGFWQVPLDLLASQAQTQEDDNNYIPPLATLADSLITAYLDSRDGTSLQMYLMLYVSALYSQIEGTREPGFAEGLRSENRHFHRDAVSGRTVAGLPALTRQREIRKRLRETEGEGVVEDST
ncbi:hypothetical protein PG993_003839 [Apiospora rasikravindrae]|uniref:Uncharacterized protein n=1 Tax=Apiospora rasikravindrae TaxID=990691 RepID=A0ABR1U0N9_9PEZI